MDLLQIYRRSRDMSEDVLLIALPDSSPVTRSIESLRLFECCSIQFLLLLLFYSSRSTRHVPPVHCFGSLNTNIACLTLLNLGTSWPGGMVCCAFCLFRVVFMLNLDLTLPLLIQVTSNVVIRRTFISPISNNIDITVMRQYIILCADADSCGQMRLLCRRVATLR
jgi:hypothetical protein